jgi:hypothetical protein
MSALRGWASFFRVSGDGDLLSEAISLRRGRRVNLPDDSAGCKSAALAVAGDGFESFGSLLADSFRRSALGRFTRAIALEGAALGAICFRVFGF